jgi:hypothetical protein
MQENAQFAKEARIVDLDVSYKNPSMAQFRDLNNN